MNFLLKQSIELENNDANLGLLTLDCSHYEMLAESQRDLTAEQAAEKLRAVSDVHFRSNP